MIFILLLSHLGGSSDMIPIILKHSSVCISSKPGFSPTQAQCVQPIHRTHSNFTNFSQDVSFSFLVQNPIQDHTSYLVDISLYSSLIRYSSAVFPCLPCHSLTALKTIWPSFYRFHASQAGSIWFFLSKGGQAFLSGISKKQWCCAHSTFPLKGKWCPTIPPLWC